MYEKQNKNYAFNVFSRVYCPKMLYFVSCLHGRKKVKEISSGMFVLLQMHRKSSKPRSKYRLESDWIVGTEQPSFSGFLVLSMCAATNPT